MGKLTDNEIIKALECCLSDIPPCITCKYDNDTITCDECMGELMKDALDLINRQKAEIERYKGVIKILEKDVKDAEGRAVKEFAHYLIDNGEEGKINTFDLPDYVCEFLRKPEKVEHDSLCETETYKGGE